MQKLTDFLGKMTIRLRFDFRRRQGYGGQDGAMLRGNLKCETVSCFGMKQRLRIVSVTRNAY